MEYSEGKLLSLLSQYAIKRIELIQSSGNKIYVKFKEGHGTSWHNDWFESEIIVDNLTDFKESCKKHYLVEAEERYREENGLPPTTTNKSRFDPYKDLFAAKLHWCKVFGSVVQEMIEKDPYTQVWEIRDEATKRTNEKVGYSGDLIDQLEAQQEKEKKRSKLSRRKRKQEEQEDDEYFLI